MEPVAAEVLGEELDDRTPAGLWPSDHAGVVATLHLARPYARGVETTHRFSGGHDHTAQRVQTTTVK
jgi:hypothetical protein